MKQVVHVGTKEPYEIAIGSGILEEIVPYLRQFPGSRIAVITDTNVMEKVGNRLVGLLNANGIAHGVFPIKPGEKTRKSKEKVEDSLLDGGYGRDTIILAFGGGTVGDLAGFVASTYQRGVPFIQIPTTLLAMVDSSVGGKTGIDTRHGKNMIGSFHQPLKVFADVSLLSTLPEAEMANGMAEGIKHAAIMDKTFFRFLEKNKEFVHKREDRTLVHIVKRCCEIKSSIVTKDEKEVTGARQVLNFGHTIGHSIEALSDYKVPHGSCVSIGMAAEAGIAAGLGLLTLEDKSSLMSLLEMYGLPVSLPRGMSVKSIIEKAGSDKKSVGGEPRYVLLEGIGRTKGENGRHSFPAPRDIAEKSLGDLT